MICFNIVCNVIGISWERHLHRAGYHDKEPTGNPYLLKTWLEAQMGLQVSGCMNPYTNQYNQE